MERSPLASGQVFSHYRILSLLGKGGMGEVYLAQDSKLDRKVALKILPLDCASNPERMQRFLREAKVTSSLTHPCIAHVYEIDESQGIHFIAMEYVEGETLARRINASPMDAAEILEISIQVADGLQDAHSKGVTHRDIKSDNVMLTPKGQLKILDFGLARILREVCSGDASDLSTVTYTPAGTLMGTVEYMSPEQILGKEVDHRTDLFSLGIVLYEMTTGRLPFLGANRNETMDRILHAQPEAMARFNYTVPAELERIIRKCLEKDREHRFQSAREVVIDLKNLQKERELARIALLHDQPLSPLRNGERPDQLVQGTGAERTSRPSRLVRFGVFELRLQTGELWKDGQKIKLQDQPFHVLAMLLEKPGEMVSREQFNQRLWPRDVSVDFDHNLNAAVTKLRQALGDSADTPRYIETLPRRGYRFICPVEPLGPDGPPLPGTPTPVADPTPALRDVVPVKTASRSFQKRILRLPVWSWFLVAGLLLVLFPRIQDWVTSLTGPSLPRKKHLVVLPFKNVGEDQRNKLFCDGLLETITAKLTQLQQFQRAYWVVPAVEVSEQKISSLSKAKGALGVNLAITGSVQRSPDSIRVTLNLVELETFRQLKSQVNDYPLTNLQALEDGVIVELSRMLELEVAARAEQLWAAEKTRIPKAYEHYAEARGYLQQYQKTGNIDQAIYAFQDALKEDPNYTLAYAGLGEACWYKYATEHGDASWMEKAKTNSLMALKLTDQLAPVHVTRGLILKESGDYGGAQAAFQRALELDPMSDAALRNLARTYESMQELTQAEGTYRKAIELKPDYWGGYYQLAVFFYLHNRYAEAIPQSEKVVALAPENPWGHNNLGVVYLQLEQWGKAKKMFERSLQCEWNYSAAANLGLILFFEGKFPEAAEQYEAALKQNDGDYAVWGNLGSAYHWAGNEPKSQENYRRAIQKGEARLKVNPSDADLRADLAVYQAMLGDRIQALALMEKGLMLNPKDASIMYRAGLNYEHWGERELALQWVGKALKNGYSLSTVKRSPELKNLREDPRFGQLISERGDNR
jgi:serine/threonine protein kinase/tetratricopeptide (TPR) repeat protein